MKDASSAQNSTEALRSFIPKTRSQPWSAARIASSAVEFFFCGLFRGPAAGPPPFFPPPPFPRGEKTPPGGAIPQPPKKKGGWAAVPPHPPPGAFPHHHPIFPAFKNVGHRAPP